ncbi:MAG TPA: ABC transporter ATP-binding protein [Bacteroidia bacterium]|nr:ABC transporter ATP-binding protein [Bacteroidia bacterium]
MITAENISKSFGKLKVLNSISVSCDKGETISLIGPNSSGKTTLIKCLLGMVIPDSGKILFDNENISRSWQYRDRIGYMPQIGRYPENMTIGEVFDMLLDLRKKKENETDRELVHSFGLDAILNKRMRTLSGGTRQKVSASIAFLFHPQVLILDEPTAGLDPVASEALKEKIRKEKEKGRLILITSHILSDLDDLVTRVIYIQEGNVLFHKSISQLRSDTGEEKLSRAIAAVMKNNQPLNSVS